ncbi:hypothetical protein U9M48_042596 [Paspalum notatum var. saurae]|uniref:Helitron helicase-like domain-containing protein n=1 Tax=Paspalum notatum var. saurae TaxID=547442 RepID=A0AAQ3XGA8_PASNO
MFDKTNDLVKSFRPARDLLVWSNSQPLRLRLLHDRPRNSPQYGAPVGSEIAVLIVGDFTEGKRSHDVIVQARGGGLRRISNLHSHYMALQYPVLFPYGEEGFKLKIKYNPVKTRKEITILEYYAFRLQQRRCEEPPSFVGIHDALHKGDFDGDSIGKKVILPASFIGSKRYMVQNHQDAMAICRFYGPPDLFITFTCNTKWQEIVDALAFIPGQRLVEELVCVPKKGVYFGRARAGCKEENMRLWTDDVIFVVAEEVAEVGGCQRRHGRMDPVWKGLTVRGKDGRRRLS